MAFSYSNNLGCNANENTVEYNPNSVDDNYIYRLAHINELRKSIEDWYSGNGLTVPNWNTIVPSSLTMNKVRGAHVNELRTAINKLRTTTQRLDCLNNVYSCGNGGGSYSCPTVMISCSCNRDCHCTCDSILGCTCASNCRCDTITYKYALLGAFTFSNTIGDVSGAGTRLTILDKTTTNDISKLRISINYINDNATIEGKQMYNNDLSF